MHVWNNDRFRLRCGDADANTGEASRAYPDQDPVGTAAVQKRLDDRHQALGVAAADQLVVLGEALAIIAEQSGAAGSSRCVDRKYHGARFGHMLKTAATPGGSASNCFDAFHFGNVVADQALDAALQGDRR